MPHLIKVFTQPEVEEMMNTAARKVEAKSYEIQKAERARGDLYVNKFLWAQARIAKISKLVRSKSRKDKRRLASLFNKNEE